MNQKANDVPDGGTTRREFIKKSTLAATAVAAGTNLFKTPVYGQTQAPSPGRVIGANDRLVVAYIGVGAQGFNAHVHTQKADAAANNIVQAAVCDLSTTRQGVAKKFILDGAAAGATCDTYKDYEKILERKDIDAVTISTVDHWHARVSMAALDAGKHVYVEKPMTRYLGEAFDLYDKVKSTGKVLQVGSQGCSAIAWHKAAELIQKGQLGPLVWGQGFYPRNNPKGEWNYDIQGWCLPADLDWDKWQAPVHNKTPFSADSYFRWRKYYPYCAGLLGDLVPHRLNPLMLATGNPEFPCRVVSIGTNAIHTDKNSPNTPERDSPEHMTILAEFPSGLTLVVGASSVAGKAPGFAIYGQHASINIGGSGERLELIPEKDFSEDVDLLTLDGLTPTESIPAHEQNWFECIRSNKEPNAGITLGTKAQTVISLAEMSQRLKVACLFDEKTRKISTGNGKEYGINEFEAITYGTLKIS